MWIRNRWVGRVAHFVLVDGNRRVQVGNRVTARCGKTYKVQLGPDRAGGMPVCAVCVTTLLDESERTNNLVAHLLGNIRRMRNTVVDESDEAKFWSEEVLEKFKEAGWR